MRRCGLRSRSGPSTVAEDLPGAPRRLVLASASPRRLELLRLAGLDPEVRAADVDESIRVAEEPEVYVARLARAKARAVADGRDKDVEAVLGADTTVVCDGVVMGKPRDAEDARRMLSRLNGRVHEVITAVAVTAGGSAMLEDRVLTRVRVTPLTAARIAAYVASGEPMGKAGGYAIQGRAAAFVERIEGSYTNVVGLPLVEALVLLRRAGVPMP